MPDVWFHERHSKLTVFWHALATFPLYEKVFLLHRAASSVLSTHQKDACVWNDDARQRTAEDDAES